MKNGIQKRLLAISILLVLCVTTLAPAFGAPLIDVPMTLTQPDGSVLECYASGDEFFNYLHDEYGNLIKKNEETGYYVYADFIDGEVVTTDNTVTPGGLFKNDEAGVKKISVDDLSLEYIRKVYEENAYLEPALDTATASNGKYNGTIQNLVIYIKFADTTTAFPSSTRQNELTQLFNTGTSSLKSYFNEASYSKTQVNTVFCSTSKTAIVSYQDKNNRSYYVNYDSDNERTKREHTLLRDAIIAVKDNIPKDLNLDINDDGNVDSITFVVYGNTEGWSSLLWPHKWSLFTFNESINGKRVYNYSFQLDSRVSSSGVGVLAHETLHVVGFADLYRYNENTVKPVGSWDIMAESSGQHPNAYTKEKIAGWTTAKKITESGKQTLSPLTSASGNSVVISSPYGHNEYIVVEYRKNTGSFEGQLKDSGLLIYRINPNSSGNANANNPPVTGGTVDEVFVYRGSDGIEKAAYKSGSKTYFGDTSNPLSVFSDGKSTGIYISDVSAAGSTISFYVGIWFCDAKLESIVRSKINKPTGALTKSDLEKITSLEINGSNAEWRLEGIENLTNLSSLNLSYMTIRGGLHNVYSMPNLKSLSVSHCTITGS